MARRVTFFDFNRALATGGMPVERLGEYVRFDDLAPVPRLVFKEDALTDAPPLHYDIDEEIHRFLRKKRGEEGNVGGRIRVVADGDSWFDLPEFFRRRAIADVIQTQADYRMVNVAQWGRTLKTIMQKRLHDGAIAREQPHYFMFTAGGNDLQEALAGGTLLSRYVAGQAPAARLLPKGQKLFTYIHTQHVKLFTRMGQLYPAMKILCHSYDYPRPSLRGGRYIGRHLLALGFPPAEMKPMSDFILKSLSDAIEQAAAACPNAEFIDLKGKTDLYTWSDDMHPDNDGFAALADCFTARMP